VGGDAGDVNAAPLELEEEEDVEAPKPHRVDGEEVALDDAGRLLAQELAPTQRRSSRCGVDAVAAEDVPDRAGREREPKPSEFAVYALVAPARVLGRQAQHELPRLRNHRRPARRLDGVAPATRDELAMPTQKRRRLHEQRTHARQCLAECREQDPIGWAQLRPSNLTPEHLQLVPKQQDLHLLLLRASKQQEQLHQAADQPVGQGKALNQQTLDAHALTLRPDRPPVSTLAARYELVGPTGAFCFLW